MWGEDTRSQKPILADTKYTNPSDQKIKSMLTAIQYRVTQVNDTEPAFDNKYWDKELFSS